MLFHSIRSSSSITTLYGLLLHCEPTSTTVHIYYDRRLLESDQHISVYTDIHCVQNRSVIASFLGPTIVVAVVLRHLVTLWMVISVSLLAVRS